MPTHALGSPDEAQSALAAQNYLADRSLATAVFLAGELEQPLLLEGEAGVGKTEAAKALVGAKVGDERALETPRGERRLTIVSIS